MNMTEKDLEEYRRRPVKTDFTREPIQEYLIMKDLVDSWLAETNGNVVAVWTGLGNQDTVAVANQYGVDAYRLFLAAADEMESLARWVMEKTVLSEGYSRHPESGEWLNPEGKRA